jgi:hypothetical protein
MSETRAQGTTCRICSKSFSQPYNLKQHLKNIHKIVRAIEEEAEKEEDEESLPDKKKQKVEGVEMEKGDEVEEPTGTSPTSSDVNGSLTAMHSTLPLPASLQEVGGHHHHSPPPFGATGGASSCGSGGQQLHQSTGQLGRLRCQPSRAGEHTAGPEKN